MSVIAGLAPAKINLSLRVATRRADGFHEIDSVIAFLDLCDSLLFSPADKAVQELHMAGRTQSVPADQRNLVLRAGEALADHAGRDLPFSAVLDKRIPAGSGLGGGSSDAATTLVVLNALHQLDIPTEELMKVGSSVGSDVPMFVRSNVGSCRIRGRGETVEALAWSPQGHCVLMLPEVHSPTPAVYAAWDLAPCSSPPARATPCRGGREVPGWLANCFNDLQEAAFSLFPQLQLVQQHAEGICGRRVVLTGSGSALFTAFQDAAEAQEMAGRITEEVDVETLVVPFRTGAGNPLPEVQHADH
jgi:4-diphosphocytidyl-2-C-methyl-D-erythritol kinase